MDSKPSFFLRLVLLTQMAVGAAWASEGTKPYTGDEWSFLDGKKVMAAAAEIIPAKYPDCDEATVDEKVVNVYRPDGTGESQDESFVKTLTEKGKRNNQTFSQSYMLPYSTVEVVKLEVIKPDGKTLPVDLAANSQEKIDDSQMQMNIYDPNDRVLQVNIPGIEIGDILHSITRETTKRPFMPGEYFGEQILEGQGYIHHFSYDIYAPDEKPLKHVILRDEIPGTVKYTTQPVKNHTLLHHWEVSHVPRMFDEPSMPPANMVLQRLLVSTVTDWKAVSQWYWNLSKPHLDAATPEMKKFAEELTAGAKTDLDKVKALFYFVSKKIRYMGITPEKDRPGFEPHDVCITFNKKYGVCRDKAALLVSLLKAAGLNAYPVLISAMDQKDLEVPDSLFNHAISGVELKKGEYVLMDPTDENARDLLNWFDCNSTYLVCRPEGEDLKISSIKSPDDHLMKVKTTGVLNSTGGLDAKSELVFGGDNDNVYRNSFAEMKPDDIRRFFERSLKQAMPGAVLKSIKLTPEDMMDISREMKAEIEFSVEGLTAQGRGKSMVSLPWVGKEFGMINFLVLPHATLEKRKYPFRTELVCGLQEELTLQLPEDIGEMISVPLNSSLKDACLDYRQEFDFKKGTLHGSRELKLKTVEFTPPQYLALKQTLKTMAYDERKSPLMVSLDKNKPVQSAKKVDREKIPPVASSAKFLDIHSELDVKDPHAALWKSKYSAQILNYEGKKQYSEIKIAYNTGCEEARLVRGVVISKTGQRQEISKDEIHIMDADWNSSAKRYSGGKILVANLPGVDVGSTIEVEYEIASKDKPFLGGFESFQMADEVRQKEFQLTAPSDVQIQKKVMGGLGNLGEVGGRNNQGGQSFQWNAQNIKAMPREAGLPPEWVYDPVVNYFVGDLKAYLKELNETMLDRSRKSAKAAEMAGELVKSCGTSPLEKVKAIRDFVAKSIRLAGPSFVELPLKELSPADTTLAEGYGHSADRAILLHAMLTAVGFQPEFELSSDLPAIKGISETTQSFPMPGFFQNPLVRIALGGESYYLNDTDQYSKLGATFSDGKLGLLLSSRDFEEIHATRECREKTETDYALSVGENGNTRIKTTYHFYGTLYDRWNRYFSELPPEERNRYYQQLVSNMAQGARPVGDLKTQFDTYPGLEEWTVEVDHYSVLDGKCLYFDLPFTPSLFSVGSDHRTLPLLIGSENENIVHTEIQFPAGFHHLVIAPKNEDLAGPDGGGKARVLSEDVSGKHRITHEFKIQPAIIDPKDYPEMLRINSELGKKSSRLILLEKD